MAVHAAVACASALGSGTIASRLRMPSRLLGQRGYEHVVA
jgi:hypothetical protein